MSSMMQFWKIIYDIPDDVIRSLWADPDHYKENFIMMMNDRHQLHKMFGSGGGLMIMALKNFHIGWLTPGLAHDFFGGGIVPLSVRDPIPSALDLTMSYLWSGEK